MASYDIPLPRISHPHEVDAFLRKFKEVLWKHRETSDKRMAMLFELCLEEGSSAETWFEVTCPVSAKESWDSIKVQLEAIFRTKESDQKHLHKLQNLRITDVEAQDEDFRFEGIKNAKACAKKIAVTYNCDEAKANIIKGNIGEETRNLMNIKTNIVEGVCEALRVLDEHQVGIIKKRVEAANVKESVTALTAKKMLSNVNFNATTTHQGSTTANVGNQVATTSTQLTVRPRIDATGRTQNQAVYTPEQRTKLAAWKAKNGDNVTYGCDLPLVGKEPLGSNECNGCGSKGYRAVECQFDKLDLAEQKLRKIHNDRARSERIARNATTYMTPTAIEPVHFTDDVEETGGARLRIEEGNGEGQE
ncbi:hypothetical protein QFC20_006738 [Naganishia adeliensis]|uniref:Uncharacterized protein n=1 Tax=Naganishia adeliensis TaxID=92952 RepID=A0ACC2V7Q3_9TREE|nr:hypothetical protein QFC20_006738 [Naganishia adeliensis]